MGRRGRQSKCRERDIWSAIDARSTMGRMAASADERVDADQRRDVRLIVDQRVGVERRGLIAELLVQMLSSGLSPDSRLARS
jgi:hypothetical protein